MPGQPTEPASKKYGDYESIIDGPGYGAIGLPGDYTSASRFVRTAFQQTYTEAVTGLDQGIKNIHRILSFVQIPKGGSKSTRPGSPITPNILELWTSITLLTTTRDTMITHPTSAKLPLRWLQRARLLHSKLRQTSNDTSIIPANCWIYGGFLLSKRFSIMTISFKSLWYGNF